MVNSQTSLYVRLIKKWQIQKFSGEAAKVVSNHAKLASWCRVGRDRFLLRKHIHRSFAQLFFAVFPLKATKDAQRKCLVTKIEHI